MNGSQFLQAGGIIRFSVASAEAEEWPLFLTGTG